MGEANVCFQIDTDNRENFSSGLAFHAFRKQRDAFYDILRIWEENHLVPGWVFQIALGGRIRSMLTMHNDSTNYYHIARLFKSQLLISCIQKGHQVSPKLLVFFVVIIKSLDNDIIILISNDIIILIFRMM